MPSSINRRDLFATLVTLAILFTSPFPISALAEAPTTTTALPSWNDGPVKQAIVDFVKAATDPSSPNFVPTEARIATFDQDGTLWVEHPLYSQVVYCLGAGAGQSQARTCQCRTLQDGVVRGPRGNGKADNA